MTKDEGLRERKKRETRKTISDVATQLFLNRGFENVSVAEIADAAKVAKMTVFNYFPRKEDLFFDRHHESLELARAALAGRTRDRSPVRALRDLGHELVERRHPFTKFDCGIEAFWHTVRESPALRSRERELREELEYELARLLADSVSAEPTDPLARLVSSMVVASWRVAYVEGLRCQRAGRSAARARAVFLAWLDKGLAMVRVGAKGTPYE